jgi:riboflavin kinase/FMN adenylyltransferase
VIVAPARVPPLIQSNSQKLRTLEALGVDVTWLIQFDEKFSQQTGETFVRRLHAELGHLLSVCVGSEFTFGHKRSGSVSLLQQLGGELHFDVHGLAAVALDGQVVSSTRIRDAISRGELDAADQMLGRTYALDGRVVRGDQLGRKLGFPTANLDVPGRILPPNGVYAAHADTSAMSHRAVVNIGVRPTVGDAIMRRVETHLLDFDGDLYGQQLEITFAQRLRDEKKFASLDELKHQIAADITVARQWFES